jgi:hypothetical protein
MDNYPRSLWHFLTWIFPTICVASVFVTIAISPEAIDAWVVSPHGFLENSPSAFLIIGICFCVSMLRKDHVWDDKTLRFWLFAFIAASVYFGGEDENWSEYWFNWDTPQYFLENNKEQETNIHNMSTWFNQKPRLAMDIWALVACMLVPLGWTWPKRATAKFVPAVFWPQTTSFIFVVVLCFMIEIADQFDNLIFPPDGLQAATGIRLSEVQEMTLAYLMLLYAMDLHKRLTAPVTAQTEDKVRA